MVGGRDKGSATWRGLSSKTVMGSDKIIFNHLRYKNQMQAVLGRLEAAENYKEGLRAACKANRIAAGVLNGLTLKKMRMFQQRTLKHYHTNPQKAQTTWFQNELRLYHWLLLIHSFLNNTLVLQLQLQVWQDIQSIFFPKPLPMLEFQAKKLISSSPLEFHRAWHPEQCELLREVMSEDNMINKWNEVSRNLYERSGHRHYRSGKQCREQWFNHLDHTKKHGQWTPHEDRAILEFVMEKGHKWAQLCRDILPARTEHMIKNRFKSLIIRQLQDRQRGTYNERKIIRKILAKDAQKMEITPPPFKIANLKTYHSEEMEVAAEGQDSMLERLPPADDHIQIINNSSAERQNQQKKESVVEGPLSQQQHTLVVDNIPGTPPQNMGNLYSQCQITQSQFQITQSQFQVPPLGHFLPSYYTIFPTSILFTGSFPFNQQ